MNDDFKNYMPQGSTNYGKLTNIIPPQRLIANSKFELHKYEFTPNFIMIGSGGIAFFPGLGWGPTNGW